METNPQKELFNVQIGKVARVTLNYGPNGQSKGVATIQFAQKGDAKKAYDRYDNKLIDNTKRLKVGSLIPPTLSR
jgi:THO complex subunit 4